jgi:hypothetical protein
VIALISVRSPRTTPTRAQVIRMCTRRVLTDTVVATLFVYLCALTSPSLLLAIEALNKHRVLLLVDDASRLPALLCMLAFVIVSKTAKRCNTLTYVYVL